MQNNKPRVGFFDLETTALLEQAPAWKLRPCRVCGEISTKCDSGIIVEGNEGNLHSVGMSVAAVRDTSKAHSFIYFEEHSKDLIKHLHSFDLIVGYNIRRFDYIVLEKYGGTMLKYLPTFDMFLEVKNSIDKNISLNNFIERTLGIKIDKLGPKSVDLWWSGEKEKVSNYCKLDVGLAQKIFNYACQNGYLRYWNHEERKVVSLDTSYWAGKARNIVESEVPEVVCPIDILPELDIPIEQEFQMYIPYTHPEYLDITQVEYGD